MISAQNPSEIDYRIKSLASVKFKANTVVFMSNAFNLFLYIYLTESASGILDSNIACLQQLIGNV